MTGVEVSGSMALETALETALGAALGSQGVLGLPYAAPVAGQGEVLRGILTVVAISLVAPAVVLAALHARRLAAALRDRASRRRPVPEAPALPLETLVARLRRLHPAVHRPRPGTPMAKHAGTVMAYDEALAAVASALGHPTSLPQLDLGGFDREAERLRVEHVVVAAGVDLDRAA